METEKLNLAYPLSEKKNVKNSARLLNKFWITAFIDFLSEYVKKIGPAVAE